jgi:adenine-specific DNA-methyltransferase
MAKTDDIDFSIQTLDWLKSSDLKKRQSLGQFMTPRFLRAYLLDQLEIPPGSRVLDPAVGTGEFLRQAVDRFPSIKVIGWDIDEKILDVAKSLVPEADLACRSGLDDYEGEKFDFVIGNPPYFEMKLEPKMKDKFRHVVSGRANIYSLFFQVGIDALRDGGTLAYVVPPSMNAGAYFKKLRQFLTLENHLVSLKIFAQSDHFVDAQTSVQVIVVRKGLGKSKHVFSIKDNESAKESTIFCERPSDLKKLYKDSVSLFSLGYEAVTGTTVWNQYKDSLTNEADTGTIPLLYARNIVDGGVALGTDPRRPQFIRGGRSMTGPAIVVNRIIGGVGKGTIKAGLVPLGFVFAAENHLNVIRPIPGRDQVISLEALFDVIAHPETAAKARLLTGNTQLSASEWTYLIPFSLES